ncbi:MAG: class I SAM-dependent methyltransferase [Clostridium sp.]|nr:class I SAM-dependent methyltransferase [Clostridium sp.]
MKNITIDYYNKNAKAFAERTVGADMSICQNKFLSRLKAGSCILDAGCGSGRDSKIFLERGFRVEAMDASEEMCRIAAEYIGQPVTCMGFEEVTAASRFDGIWACASLLHVEKCRLPDILLRFQRALKPDGILYASVKYGDAEEERLERFFSDYHLDEMENVFLQDGLFELLDSFETEDVRPDYRDKPWVNIIVKKRN